MVSPRLGAALLTDLVITRSARCGVSVALALSLPVLGSNWSRALTVAVFVWASGLSTVAVMIRVALPRLATAPTSHTPVPEVYVPWLGVLLTIVSPAGNRSVTLMPLASLGPLLVSVMVKVIVSSTLGVALLTTFV